MNSACPTFFFGLNFCLGGTMIDYNSVTTKYTVDETISFKKQSFKKCTVLLGNPVILFTNSLNKVNFILSA